jgi:hypothetical protein
MKACVCGGDGAALLHVADDVLADRNRGARTSKDIARRCERSRNSFDLMHMDHLQFVVPVRIMPVPGRPITEIYGVEHALEFLQNWSNGHSNPFFQTAVDACFAATVDIATTEEARSALMIFVRVSGILAKDMLWPSPAAAALKPPVRKTAKARRKRKAKAAG